jgi:hypothetical protein
MLTAVYSGDTAASGYSNYAGSTSSSVSFVISSTALAVSTTSLTISPTSGPFGSPITLTTTGDSGTGAVTFAVTNGTDTGCSVSGDSLTATSSGTCLVTATQASDSTHLGQSSNVTTVNFFWTYAAIDEIVGQTAEYEEEEVETGEECTQYGGGQCQVWTPTYTEEDVFIGYDYEYAYECPYGGSLSGYICTMSGGSGPNVRHAFIPTASPTNSSHIRSSITAGSPKKPMGKHPGALFDSSAIYIRKDHLDGSI